MPKFGFSFAALSGSASAPASAVWPKDCACDGKAWRDLWTRGEMGGDRGRGERDVLLCERRLRLDFDARGLLERRLIEL